MKINIKKIGLVAGVFAAVCVFQSCTDLTPTVYSEMDSEEFKKSDEYIASELGKVYSHLQREYGYVYRQGYWSIQENTTDECVVPTRYAGDWYDGGVFWEMHNNRLTQKSREINEYGISANGAFAMPYNGIAKINAMIKAMKEMGSDKQHPEVIAELKVFRAWYHMLLLDVFGRTGFYTETTDLSGKHPQCERPALFDSIMNDLDTYVPLLEKEKHYCRINYYVGRMIQAKMYLNAEAWEVVGKSATATSAADCYTKVYEYCDEIINSGQYHLESDYFNNFLVNNENSAENMWCVYYDASASKGMQFHMMTLHYSQKDTYGLKATPWNGYCTTERVLGIYDKTDYRLLSWLRGEAKDASGKLLEVTVAVDSATYAAMPKYVRLPKNWPATMPDSVKKEGKSMSLSFPAYFTDTVTTLTNNEKQKVYNVFEGARFAKFEYQRGVGEHMSNDFPIYRLADVYLMKAEALLRGGGDMGKALEAVNTVRNRSGVTALVNLTFDELCNERVRELCWEGHRRTDLIRFGRFTGSKSIPDESDPANLWTLRTSKEQPYDTHEYTPEEAEDFRKVCPIPEFMIDYGYTQNTGY